MANESWRWITLIAVAFAIDVLCTLLFGMSAVLSLWATLAAIVRGIYVWRKA